MESWFRQILERAKALAMRDVPRPVGAPPTNVNVPIAALPGLAKDVREARARVLAAERRSSKSPEPPDELERLTWIEWSVSDVAKLAELPADDAVELLGVATYNHDGYVREAALKHLAARPHPRAVRFALQRLGDWVLQVRAAAEALTFELLRAGYLEAFLANYDAIQAAERIVRVDLEPVLERIRAHLRSADVRVRVLGRLESTSRRERMFVARLLEDEIVTSRDLAERVARDPSPAIRAWTAERLAKSPQAHPELLAELVSDANPLVARAAIQWLPLPLDPRFGALVAARIDSPMRGLRESSRFALSRSGVADFAERYRSRIAAGPPASGAIEGLGEVGERGDLATVLAFADSPDSRLRAAALRAACALDRDSQQPRLLAALRAGNRRARKVARRELAEALDDKDVRVLREDLSSLPEPQRRAIRRLLAVRSGWDCVPDLLDGLGDPAKWIRRASSSSLERWYAKHGAKRWILPTETTRRALAEALGRFDSRPPPGVDSPSLPHVLAWAREVCGAS